MGDLGADLEDKREGKKEKGGADQQEIGRKGGGGWKKRERER